MTVESTQHDTGIRFLLVAASGVVIIAGLRAAAPIILPFLIAVFSRRSKCAVDELADA